MTNRNCEMIKNTIQESRMRIDFNELFNFFAHQTRKIFHENLVASSRVAVSLHSVMAEFFLITPRSSSEFPDN